MQRRQFLTGISAVGSIGLAGCALTETGTLNGQLNDSEPSPRRIDGTSVPNDDAKLSLIADVTADRGKVRVREKDVYGPRSDDVVRFGDEFEVAVVVEHIGDESDATIQCDDDQDLDVTHVADGGIWDGKSTQSASETVDLQLGETGEVRLGPYHAVATGTWAIRPGGDIASVHDAFYPGVTVRPRNTSMGLPAEIERDVSLTVRRFEPTHHILRTYGTSDHEQVGLETAPDGRCYVHTALKIENYSDAPFTPGSVRRAHRYDVSPIDPIEDVPNGTLSDVQLEGQPFSEVTVESGEKAYAWLLGTADVDRVNDLEFTFSHVKDDLPVESHTDIAEQYALLPEFELENVRVPDRWRAGPQTISVTVSKEGPRTTTFHGVIQYDTGDGEGFRNPSPAKALKYTYFTGSTKELLATFDLPEDTRYRIQPFGEEFVL